MVRRRTRVTIVLRERDQDTGLFITEWAHAEDVDMNAEGVTLRWPHNDASTWIPYTSILKIDREPCGCDECRKQK